MHGGSIPWVRHFLFCLNVHRTKAGLGIKASFGKYKYSFTGKSWDKKAAEQDEKLEEQERRGEVEMEKLELKLLAKFEETSAIQDKKMTEQETKIAEQEERIAEQEQKLTEQEEKISDQERQMTEIVKDLTLVRLGVTARHPGLKSFLGNATISTSSSDILSLHYHIFDNKIIFVMIMMVNDE